jgi:hypothetical protein
VAFPSVGEGHMMRNIANSALFAVTLAAMQFASGATLRDLTEAQAGPLQGMRCPAGFLPVCAVADNKLMTFGNSCEAHRANGTILHDGKCQGDGEKRCPRNNAFPVCGMNIRTGVRKTYDNVCWAEKDLAVVLNYGVCK